jgi:hypothetical protein
MAIDKGRFRAILTEAAGFEIRRHAQQAVAGDEVWRVDDVSSGVNRFRRR